MIKLKKRVFSFWLVLALMLGITGMDGFALEEGAYIVSNTTSYKNPDTGKTDDGGTDTSIGDGMARNMTYPTALYELKEGKHYVTVRFKMISYIDNVQFKVQSKKGDGKSYKSISHEVVGENKAEDTKDYQIELSSMDVHIQPTFFVKPMNRDVTYFISFDLASAKANDGSFGVISKKSGQSSNIQDEKEKMPEIVEELTGVSIMEPSTEDKKTSMENRVSDANAKTESIGVTVAEKEQKKIDAAGILKEEKNSTEDLDTALEVEKKKIEEENDRSMDERTDSSVSAETKEIEDSGGEKAWTETKESEGLERAQVQGLTEFDSRGELVENHKIQEEKKFLRPVAGTAVAFMGAAVYFVGKRKTKN